MLSAVAARKARLQGKEQTVPTPAPPSPKSPSPPVAENAAKKTRPSVKRKPSNLAQKPSREKSRKVNKSERYFAVKDGFEEQDDVIAIEDEEERVFSSDDESSSDVQESMINVTIQRAWSPSVPVQDSSEDETDGIPEPQTELPDTSLPYPVSHLSDTPTLLSTYHPILGQNIFNISDAEIHELGISLQGEARVLALAVSEKLALLGTYTLTVLRGSVVVAGVILQPSRTEHKIYAPRSSPIPVIDSNGAASRDEPLPLPTRFKGINAAHAVVLLQEFRTGVEGLGHVCKIFEGFFEPSRWQRNQAIVDLGIPGVHYISLVSHDVQPLILASGWKEALSSSISPADEGDVDYSRRIYLVKGAKKTGKSTFTRIIVNRLLSRYRRVAFLECDIGQSEFTPGGMVALNIISQPIFGPPFTHPSIPHQAHYIGSTSPRSCPSRYLESIQALVQTYNRDIQSHTTSSSDDEDSRITEVIPLVVNMMGWTKGLGADLCRQIEEMVEPSDVFEFEAPMSEHGWPGHTIPDTPRPSSGRAKLESSYNAPGGPRHYTVRPAPIPLNSRYSPADHRTLSLLSYFHARLPPVDDCSPFHDSYATSWDAVLPLCAQSPFEVTANEALDQVILAGPGSEDVVPSEILRVLNGAVVGLISCEPDTVDVDMRDSSNIPYVQCAAPPSPIVSICHGLALIRSVAQAENKTFLHILTPLSQSTLTATHPRVLVKGELELPVWGMLDFRSEESVAGVERSKVPFLRWGKGEGMGGEKRRVRRNLMRRGQV